MIIIKENNYIDDFVLVPIERGTCTLGTLSKRIIWYFKIFVIFINFPQNFILNNFDWTAIHTALASVMW